MAAWNLIFLNGCTAVLPAAHACCSDRGNRIIIPIIPNIKESTGLIYRVSESAPLSYYSFA